MIFPFSIDEIRIEMWKSSYKIIWGSILLLLIVSILDFLLLKQYLELVILNMIIIGLVFICYFSFSKVLKNPIFFLHTLFTMLLFLSLYSLSITGTIGNTLYMSFIVVVFVFFNSVAIWRVFDATIQYFIFCALIILMASLGLFTIENLMMSGGYIALSVCGISILFTYIRYLTIKDQIQDNFIKEKNIKESKDIAFDLQKKLRNKNSQIKDIENMAKVFRHDIKNKLGGVLSLLDIIEKEDLYKHNKDDSNYLELIKKSVSDTLNESESFMKNLDTNSLKQNIETKKDKVRLHDLINKEKVTFLEKTISRNINLKIEYTAKNDLIYVDEHLFSVAIYNILKYSVEFSNNNDTIYIKTSKKNNILVLQIINKETGMSMLKLDSYFNDINDFEPKNIGKTEGLGLSIAQNNIEAVSGNIRYSSSNSLGFEFIVEIQQET